jgi:serine/threonine-protein kinase
MENEKDARDLREDLYRVVNNYAELTQLAQQGVVDPIGAVGRILRRRLPYLILVLKELLLQLERGVVTYYEVLYTLVREVQQFSDQKVLAQSCEEIERIETEGRAFLYAIKWRELENYARPTPQVVDVILKTLIDLNAKYRQRFAPNEPPSITLIPYYMVRDEGDTEETTLRRTADLVRRALLELFRLMIENKPSGFASWFSKGANKDIEDDLMKLARFLFRCGFAVHRIASGYYKDKMCEFINEKILDDLIAAKKSLDSIRGLSAHLSLISLIDFASFFELSADYCDVEEYEVVQKQAKAIKNGNRRGASLLKKMHELYTIYGSFPQGALVQRYLAYRYQASFGDYHGPRRVIDKRGELALNLYRPVIDREAMAKRTGQDVEESGRFYSSKTREEMSSIIKLVMDSLENPEKVKGSKVKVLGDISSGAMGKVSLGIFRGEIVALKTVKSQIAGTLGDPMALLKYEAAMHARVQQPEQHPFVVAYYGLVEQDGEHLLINGYHPSDNLTQLVEKNWTAKYKPPFYVSSKLNLATVEVIVHQLLDCLMLFAQKGVVHRDLKTDNILYLVDDKENVRLLKVIDFGVALAIGGNAIEDFFKGKVVGTFSYMAPEQVRGNSVFQSDLYSVGAILSVLLTGKLPMIFPRATTREELANQIIRVEREPRPKVFEQNPLLRRHPVLDQLAALTDRMLHLDPAARPTADEAKAAFDDIFESVGDQKHSLSIFYSR